MIRTLDGIQFDTPPTAGQIVALAQDHRKKIHNAIYEKEIHLGNFTLAQRIDVYQFTRELNVEQRAQFYKIYNDELARSAEEEPLHLEQVEASVSIFAIAIVFAVIILVLWFAVVKTLMN